ncbi:MAG: hypothetical protein O7A04_03405 [Acidobacteria bacterium]|nr:hypothetical protein [Acidobacteriota bacterium]
MKTPRERYLTKESRALSARTQIRALAVLHYGGTLRKMAARLGAPLSVLSEYPLKKSGGILGAKIEAETGVPRS